MSGGMRSTIAGAVATSLACLALVPAYDGPDWFGSALLVILFIAATGYGLRQLGTPRVLVPLGQLAALGWAFILLFARDDLRLGFLPSAESVQTLLERINDGLLVVVRYAAPVPYDADLVMVTALGIGLVAVAVDMLCASFRLTPWAGLPLLLLYSIPATTVSGGISALAFVPAAVGYVLLLVSEGRDRLTRWGRVIGIADDMVGPQDAVETSLLGQTGRRVGATVIGLAVILPAALPTLPEGVFGQGSGSGFGGGQTIHVDNPIVDLNRNLQLPQDVPVMSYSTDSDRPDYIKLVTLDEYEDDRWRPSHRSVREVGAGFGDSGRLPDPPGLDPKVSRTQIRTTFEITDNLDSKWLPTPYPASALRAPGRWGYDPSTLDIVSESENSKGLTYEVTTLQVGLKPEALEAAGPAPKAIFDEYTKLPTRLPNQVLDLAKDHVAGAKNNYEKAIALQSWFRNDFIYDPSTQGGHGQPAILEFLADKRGYCEQFAATMAIMARSLGIPARVAVGYMPGTRQPDNRWLVTAHDSHAWPELYFAKYGWVRFEPTPQAQTGTAPSWTVPDSGASTSPLPDTNANPDDPRQARDRQTPIPAEGNTGPAGPTGQSPEGNGFDPRPFLAALGVLVLLAVPFLVRTSIRRARLSPRQRPGRLVEAAWRELADTAVDLGLTWDHALTPRAAGARLRSKVPHAAQPDLQRLVRAVERGRYAPDPGTASEIDAALHGVAKGMRSAAPRSRQVRAWVLPPSLWRRLPLLWRPVTRLLDLGETANVRLRALLRRSRRLVS